jgi:hypothetical protein
MVDWYYEIVGIVGGRDRMPGDVQSDQMNTRSSAQLSESADSAGVEGRAKHSFLAHQRALRDLQGSLADIPFSSDDFAKMKQKEVDREERAVARHS